jgi:hypothetical protein
MMILGTAGICEEVERLSARTGVGVAARDISDILI